MEWTCCSNCSGEECLHSDGSLRLRTPEQTDTSNNFTQRNLNYFGCFYMPRFYVGADLTVWTKLRGSSETLMSKLTTEMNLWILFVTRRKEEKMFSIRSHLWVATDIVLLSLLVGNIGAIEEENIDVIQGDKVTLKCRYTTLLQFPKIQQS